MAQKVLVTNTVPRSPSSLCLLAAIALSLVFAAAIAPSLVFAASARVQDPESCYKAKGAQEAGNYGLAIDYYTRCIDAGGLTTEDLANTYSNRGVAQYHKGDYDQAVRDYDEAIQLDPDDAESYYNRGLAHYHNAAYDQAVRDYDEAIRLDPDDAESYYNRGLAHYHNAAFDQAVRDYDEAIRLDPEYAFAYNNRGIAHYHNHNAAYDQAVRDYDEAIRLDPEYAFAYNNRGIAHYHNAAYDQAVRDFDEAIQLDPEFAFAYYNRGKARTKMGHNVQAIQDYGDAVRLNPSIAAAYVDYTKTIELKPEDASAYHSQGTASAAPTTEGLQISPAGVSGIARGSFAVHLASVRTREGAESEWNRLRRLYPELIGQRNLLTRSVDVVGRGHFVRVMTGPFENRTRAEDLCIEFKPREQYCLVVHLTGQIAIYGILFETDSANVNEVSWPALDEIATLLNTDSTLDLLVVGHTDDRGALSYNLDLSRRRAKAVVELLELEFGIAASRLEGHGVGYLAPVASNDNEAGRALNRRVELVGRRK